MADTKLLKSEIAASAFGGLAMTNERAADLCYLYLPALVGNAGTGAVTQVEAIRGLYRSIRYEPLFCWSLVIGER